jgi:hypothetical protein
MGDWEIKRPLGECSGSGRKIENGQEYYGALVETEQGLERRDFTVEFWEQAKPSVFCFWKSKFAAGEQKKSLFVDDSMLMAFFERLAAETDPDRVNFRFVLAMILMRKRRLKYDGTRTEADREIWRLRVTGDTQIVEVVNPHLSEEQIEQLSSQVGQILQMDL